MGFVDLVDLPVLVSNGPEREEFDALVARVAELESRRETKPEPTAANREQIEAIIRRLASMRDMETGSTELVLLQRLAGLLGIHLQIP